MVRESLFSKIKKAFSAVKAKFPKFSKKEEIKIDKEIEKQTQKTLQEIEKEIERLQSENDKLKDVVKVEKDKGKVLQRNLLAQPEVQKQIFQQKIKQRKKKRVRVSRIRNNIYSLNILYSWECSYVIDPDSPYHIGEFDKEKEIEIIAKNDNSAIEKGSIIAKEFGKRVKENIINITTGTGIRLIYYEINSDVKLYTENGAFVHDYGPLFSEKH